MLSKYYTVVLLFLSLFLISCGSSEFLDLQTLKENLKMKEFPSQKDYPQADALVLSENHDVNVEISENWKLQTEETVTEVIKLFKNIDTYATVEIPIYEGEKITDIHARTIKPDGTSIPLKETDFFVQSGVSDNEVFYSDRKIEKFTFPSIEKNCIIEYSYTKYEDYPFIMDKWYIQKQIPILSNTYKLTAPILLLAPENKGGANWNWRYKNYNCSLPEPMFTKNLNPSHTERDASVSFEWKMNNIPAFEPDPVMKSYNDYLEYVKFAPSNWAKWNDLSKWYNKYFYEPQFIITDEIKNKSKELTKNDATEIEKIKSIYNYVSNIRYIALELGSGSIMPTKPEEVMHRKYGDCKDKSILLCSLLKSAGIKASPVLALTADNGKVDINFPNWNFNHMIVRAETKDQRKFWLDPTAKYCSINELPHLDENINVLLLHEDGTSEIVTTPASTHRDNIEYLNVNLSLANAHDAELNMAIQYKGEFNLRYRNFFDEKTKEDMMKYCKSLVIDNYMNAKVEDYHFTNQAEVDSDLVLNIRFKVPNVIQKQGDLYFLNVDAFKLIDNFRWLNKEKRKYDIDFDFPYEVRKKMEIKLPDNVYAIRNLPENTYIKKDGLYYSKEYSDIDANKFNLEEDFAILKKDIKAEYYSNVKAFFDSMNNRLNEKIILTAK